MSEKKVLKNTTVREFADTLLELGEDRLLDFRISLVSGIRIMQPSGLTLEHWENALAPEPDPEDPDARHDLLVVRLWLNDADTLSSDGETVN